MLRRLALVLLVLAVCGYGVRRALHNRHVALLLGVKAAEPAPAVTQETAPQPIRKYHEPVHPKRLDAWEIIGPGGGGALYNPAVSPLDPNLVLASTDMGECYISQNGGGVWRQFSLRGTARFYFDPKLADRFYALVRNGGLWRTDDRGASWRLLFPDPAVARVVYVDDEGETLLSGRGGYGDIVQAFASDPDVSERLFAIRSNGELMTSIDGGASWTLIVRGAGGISLYVDASSPRENRRLFFTGGDATGFWDGAKLTTGLKVPNSTWFYGVAFGMSRTGPVLFTANDYVFKEDRYASGGILATHDGGLHWNSLNDGIFAISKPKTAPEYTALGASYFHPETLYASVFHWNIPSDDKRYKGILKTTDGGATWAPVLHEAGVLAPNVRDSWLGYRFGPDWPDQPLGIGVGPHDPNLVYTTDLGRIMKSVNGGKTWEAVYSQGVDNGYTTTGVDVTTCYGVHFDPFDPKRLFISYTDIGLFRSEDGGKSWISSTTKGVPQPWVNTTYWVEFDPASKGKMWAVMSANHDIPRLRTFKTPNITNQFKGGVVASEDGGKTWKASNRGMPEMAATHILLDPKSPPSARTLYVTGFGRGVFKSVDGGASWTAKNKGLPERQPLTWRMAMGGDGALYVVTIRRSDDGKYGNDQDGRLYVSRDGAESWEPVELPEGLNGPAGITVDPKDPARLYLSAWARYTRYAAAAPPMGGVFLSTDHGRHWTNVLDAARRIYDVTVDARDPNVVYAAGFEAAAYRSANRGLTWKRIQGFNFPRGHRIIPDPVDRSKIYVTTMGSSVWHGPAEGDLTAAEDIAGPPSMRYDRPPWASK